MSRVLSNRPHRRIFTRTSFGTKLLVVLPSDSTISKLKGEIARLHTTAYPDHGRIYVTTVVVPADGAATTGAQTDFSQEYVVPDLYRLIDALPSNPSQVFAGCVALAAGEPTPPTSLAVSGKNNKRKRKSDGEEVAGSGAQHISPPAMTPSHVDAKRQKLKDDGLAPKRAAAGKGRAADEALASAPLLEGAPAESETSPGQLSKRRRNKKKGKKEVVEQAAATAAGAEGAAATTHGGADRTLSAGPTQPAAPAPAQPAVEDPKAPESSKKTRRKTARQLDLSSAMPAAGATQQRLPAQPPAVAKSGPEVPPEMKPAATQKAPRRPLPSPPSSPLPHLHLGVFEDKSGAASPSGRGGKEGANAAPAVPQPAASPSKGRRQTGKAARDAQAPPAAAAPPPAANGAKQGKSSAKSTSGPEPSVEASVPENSGAEAPAAAGEIKVQGAGGAAAAGSLLRPHAQEEEASLGETSEEESEEEESDEGSEESSESDSSEPESEPDESSEGAARMDGHPSVSGKQPRMRPALEIEELEAPEVPQGAAAEAHVSESDDESEATPSLPSSLDDEAGVKNGDKATEVSSAGPATADADAASESSEEESNESEDSEEESEESEASSSSEEEDDDDDDAETTSEGGVPPPSSEGPRLDASKRELFERKGALAALLKRTVSASGPGSPAPSAAELAAELDRRDADDAAAAGPKSFQWQKPSSQFKGAELQKLTKIMIREVIDHDRQARGLKKAGAALYRDNKKPQWWPLEEWNATVVESRREACARVYNAARQILATIHDVPLEG
uniref:Uncharacterized protein n=1 Tax=Auxenochlorella protothecoides TaxID=3075 RepID=A0A1D1ZVG8_AUXPR